MGEWGPDQTFRSPAECTQFCTAYFWIVPAKVEGTWKLEDGELRLEQQFQKVSGTMTSGGTATPITEATLSGDAIAFTVGKTTYAGRVNGNVIEGTSSSGETRTAWRATRA
jgi:hypothetical protein